MANNNQASYGSQTVDPTIAGYAANDPYFALGLMLGRGIANNWEQRGIDKLSKSVGSPFDQNAGVVTGYQINPQGGDPQAVQQQAPIWANNSNPLTQSVNPYQIDINGGDQPLTNMQRNAMQQFINQANAPTQQAVNPVQAMPQQYQINTGVNPTIQGINAGGMTIPQLQAFMGGETPQQSAVLNAVQGAQQQKALQQTQVANPSQAGQGNSGTAQPQSATQQTGAPHPFSVQEWVAHVWEEGRRQGRPDSQIQAVIARSMPAAEAAEANSRRNVINYYTNRIFQGDDTTGGSPLIPTVENYGQVMPRLYDAINQIAQVAPEYAKTITGLLPMPTAMSAWTQDTRNLNADRQMQRNMALQRERSQDSVQAYRAKLNANTAAQQQRAANQVQQLINGGMSREQAVQAVYGGSGRGTGNRAGTTARGSGTQRAANGNQIVDGRTLTNNQQARAEEISGELQWRVQNLINYMNQYAPGSLKGDSDTIAKYGEAINDLRDYLNGLSASDRAVISQENKDYFKQILYAANDKRDWAAGYTHGPNSALTKEALERFGINVEKQ